ncbi:MAG: Rieske (2Fe-2S) protein [Nitrososphaerota archaeon]|nr:Rieske (2Fe-2S) protein [Nitrososphaerota archaeon]
MEEMYLEISEESKITEMEPFILNLAGREICLLKFQGKYYAFSNICTHIGGRLSEGRVNAHGHVTCPYHKAVFNIVTGESLSFPPRGLTTYEVKVESGKVYLKTSPNPEKWRKGFRTILDTRFPDKVPQE